MQNYIDSVLEFLVDLKNKGYFVEDFIIDRGFREATPLDEGFDENFIQKVPDGTFSIKVFAREQKESPEQINDEAN